MLTPDKLKTLNDNARKMVSLGKSKEDILAMKDAFMDRFGSEEEVAPIKKKSTAVSPSEQDQEDVSSDISTMETKKPSVSSGSVDKLYSAPNSTAVFKKVDNVWYTDVSRNGNFKQIQQGDIKKKSEYLDKVARPLFDADYEKSITWKPESAPIVSKNKGTQTKTDKKQQQLFEKDFEVLEKNDPIVLERNRVEKLSKEASNYVNKTEEQTVEELRNKFRGTSDDIFDFEETGIGNMLKITNKKTDQTITIDLDGSETEKNILGSFIESNLSFKKYNDLVENRKNIINQLSSGQGVNTQKLNEELNNINSEIKKEEFYRKGYALSKGKYASAAMYGDKKMKDASKSFDDNTSRLIGNSVVLKDEIKKDQEFDKDIKDKYSKGEITLDQYNNIVNDEAYIFKKQNIKDKLSEINEEKKTIGEDRDLMEKVIAEKALANEDRGDAASNILAGFANGFIQTTRALKELHDYTETPVYDSKGNRIYNTDTLSKEDLNDILPGIITEEYISSNKRGDLEKTLAGIAESLGAAASVPIPGAGQAVAIEGAVIKKTGTEIIKNITKKALLSPSQIGMAASSYMNFKDQINSDPETAKISEADKVLLSGAYGYVSSKLESFGMSKWFTKTPVGGKVTSWIISKAFKDLPKDASKEVIDNAINSNVKTLITKGVLNLTAKGNVEGATEALQEMSDIGLKEAYNEIEGKDIFKNGTYGEMLDRVSESYKLGLLGGALMSSIPQVLQTTRQTRTSNQVKQIEGLAKDPAVKEVFEKDLKYKVLNGQITTKQAQEQVQELNESIGLLNEIPDNVKDKTESFKLLAERKKIEKEIDGKDESLVYNQKARIEEINNELKTIGENATKESNKQEVGTEGDIVQREGTDAGQQEVGQGEGAVGEAAQPSTDTGDSNISSQEEEIIIPTEELDILNEEISKRKDEGTVVDNLDQKAFIGNEPGMIKIDSENENTVVFETKDKIIELGNIDEIKDKDIASLNLSLFPEAGVIVNDKTKAVTVDGKEYTIIGRRRDKKGQAVVRVKEVATGLERRIIGEKAEIILKDAALAPKETVAPIETKIAPEQEIAKPIKEKITPVIETKDFTLDEIQAEEERLNKEAAKFEEDLLKQISKESKKEKKLIFKVKDSEFSVTAKSDGTFSVSQKNAEGKFVGIKDDAKRKRVVSEYKKLREGNDSNRLKDAEDLSGMFKKEQDDKILSLLDRAIEATSGKGKAFDATLGLPMFVANTSLKIIKASYKAGKSLSEAIKDGYKFVKDNNYKISEYEFKKFVAENVNKKQVTPDVTTKEAVTEEAVSEEEEVKINPKDMSALKTQIKNEGRAIRDKVKQIKQVLNDISDATKELVTKGSITLKQSQAIINAVKKINFNSDESIKKSIDYISKIYKNANFASKVDKAKDIRAAIKKRIKDAPGAFKNTAKAFAEIDPRWVESIDAYNEIAELVKDSVTKARARGGKLTAKDEADINQVNTYTLKEQERQQKMRDNMLRERYANLMEITFDEATKIDMAQIKTELADSKVTEDFTEANKEAIREGIEKYNEMVDEDTDQRVKDILNFDLGLLSTKFQLEMIDTLDSYFMNGSITNLDKLTGSYKGIKGINDFVGKARSLKLLFNRSAGNRKAKELTNFNLIIEKIFVNRAVAKRFMDSIGFYDIVNGVNKAETQSKRKENDFAKKFKNEIKNGMMSAENTFEAGVIANLSRQMATGNNAKFFKDRLKMLKESVDVMRNSEDDQEVADADVYEKVFNKLGLYDDNVTLESIKEKAEPMNVEGAAYMVDMFSEVYPELSDLSLSMYNTELAKDINYTSDRYRFIKKAKETQLEKMNDSGFSLYNYVGNLKADKSGVLIESIRPENLPMDGYVDLNLYNNSFRAYKLGLKDLYTAKSIEQANSFINDKKFDKLFENNSNRELVKERLVRYVTDAKGKMYSKEDNLRALNKASEVIGLFGGARALAGASQAATQFATAMINTYANAGEHVRIFTDLSNSEFWEKVADNGLPISNVGLEVTSTLRRERDSIERAKGDKGIISNASSWALDKLKRPNEFLLKYTLQKPDEAARLIGFAAYYRQYMKENGFKGSALDGDFNMDAANYAQSMIDRNMDVTDTRLRGNLYTSNNMLIKLMKQVLFPFSSFRMNLRDRLTTDLRSLSINSTSKYGVTPGQKDKAMRSLAAIGAEMVVYNGIRLAIGKAMIYSAAGILGYDDDEIEEFVDKQTANLWKSAISNASTELFSPVPYTDDSLLKAMNWMLKITGIGDPSDNKVDEYIKKENNIRKLKGEDPLEGKELKAKKEKFLTDKMFQFYVSDEISYGALGIQPKKFMELYDVINAYKTGEYETDYKGNITNKKLTEKGREKLKSAVIMKLWSTTIGDRDTDKLSNTIFKLVKEKEGMSESQNQKYEAVKKEFKNVDAYKKSLIESSMKTENVLEEIRFIEDSFGGFTKSQSEQYAEVRASIPVEIWMIDAIKSGKTAKEILNNPD